LFNTFQCFTVGRVSFEAPISIGSINMNGFATMGYIISFFLGVFVATVGVANAAMMVDGWVHSAQVFIVEETKNIK
jgi:hypothetical protein